MGRKISPVSAGEWWERSALNLMMLVTHHDFV